MTTVSSYGEVPHHREVEIMRALAETKPVEPTEGRCHIGEFYLSIEPVLPPTVCCEINGLRRCS